MDFVYVSKVNSFILSAWRGANPNASRNPPSRRPRHAEGSYYFLRGSRPSHPRVSRPYAATVCRHVRNNPRPVCQSASSRLLAATIFTLRRSHDSIDELAANFSKVPFFMESSLFQQKRTVGHFNRVRTYNCPASIRPLLEISFYCAYLRTWEEKY